MSQNQQTKYQEFIYKNKRVIESVTLSCKKRLTKNPRITTEELFTALSKEFGDVYYEDKNLWIAYFKKNIPSILREIAEDARLESLVLEQKKFSFQDANDELRNNFKTNKYHISSLTNLPGDEHIEKSLPTGDIDDQEDPVEFTIVIPPREMPKKEIETALKHLEVEPELDLHLKPISKKTLDEGRDNNFPFGKGMLK
ncbi:MAG: hypothetical protein US57_C0010G0025 [Candidatus Moranbacteria bacterium GW2011_GWC2_37_73]|nr:MAG: hypothetical protein UR95_C0008G0037 [Parcubacteria group bacterium GW2011_GWC1_36_108]KKQ00780.1 MAG: hypothetical protein US09_C0006G0025 [Candidatus Moranbacteria bacterium GW2011_GWD1_36_198]KKQ02241.1 MAG: hypothetical protein US10_C0005G0021 [Candidatus Moranbacteria bacterium GW2011_GWD2_36_198]KKQ39706.1 MAG: hypothetical protein US57_C0010G0025 [Candidatus Moranbacteria bacterium GW2011_GWC2_37_73]HAR99656.1 hypothetical protein [Candidatus Moranbacteria bacterium]